jgi:endonuclease/exonuclease/phosphatase family metal-dependent hydrolase
MCSDADAYDREIAQLPQLKSCHSKQMRIEQIRTGLGIHPGCRMKVATFNVNGVNGRLPVLLRRLAEAKPDIVCLQELKAPQEKFPEAVIRDAGYGAIWQGQKSWNGFSSERSSNQEDNIPLLEGSRLEPPTIRTQ